jgi:hypothetical protein
VQHTHCPAGHPYSGSNLYWTPDGFRACRTCRKASRKTYYYRREKALLRERADQVRSEFQPPPLQIPAYDPLFGAWLTGLTDGEGHFRASVLRGHLTLCFEIKLRDDDRAVLEEVRETTGIGALYAGKRVSPSEHPTLTWKVGHRDVLYSAIIPHFDAYPLRTKKAHDYAIWRQIVMLAVYWRRGGQALLQGERGGDIRRLAADLLAAREYVHW